MIRLEDLTPNASVRGILPDALVTVVNVQWFGSEALELTYKDPGGRVANRLLYRDDESRLAIVEQGRPWCFDGDGSLLRLVSEAHRIRLAHLFDPVLAVHTSLVNPLPHQITAVYESMLPRQPLRFLLADDPGAGKTIMAGLFIKELIVRGDLQRCLVVCPGSLVDQWQDELYRRFQLPFDILTNDKLEAARTGNWFLENNLVIARLDKLSRDESVQDKLKAPDCRWDLIVCDEAHKMSASFFGGEVKFTKRHRLGQMLSPLTRHFLLMTATPHNGKEEDFQLFMSQLGGTLRQRETRRYEVTHVPAPIRNRDRSKGIGEPVLQRYERIAFEKPLIAPRGQPLAAFVCPGHPLLDSVLDLTLERNRDLLRRGTVLVDERDTGDTPRVLFYLEHAIQDASLTPTGERRVVSKQMLYVELDPSGGVRHLQYAPYLDYRPLKSEEPTVLEILARPECSWITRELEQKAQVHAIARVVPEHLQEVRGRRLEWNEKTRTAVKDRLTKEINYWDHRAEELKLQEQAGKVNARLNSQEARRRADDLQGRLQKRMEQLDLESQISALPPVIIGGLVVVPLGLLAKITGQPVSTVKEVVDRLAVAAHAREIVMEVERSLGFEPIDREFEKLGYDIESKDPKTGKLRFIEVKGRASGEQTLTVSRNEILYSLNTPDDFILGMVEFVQNASHQVHYLRRPFQREPDFHVTSVNYNFPELLARAEPPR